jgi:hypothetical protein
MYIIRNNILDHIERYSCIRSVLLLAALVLLSWSCQPPDPGSPIPQAELEAIITEALILEPAGRELSEVIQDSVATVYYNKILSQHGYTMEEFISAMAWLQQDADRLAAMYNKVMEKLTVIESEQK